MINILLVDDQELLCEVLKTWLQEESDLKVVGVAKNGKEGLSKIEMLQPDIVLMDIDMPEMDGLNAAQIISDRFPQVKVIFLSGHEEDDYLGKSLRTGAKGYLLKNTTAQELVAKIRNVHNSDSIVAPGENGDVLAAMQGQLEELLKTYKQKFQKQLKKAQEYQDLQEELALSEGETLDPTEQFSQLEEQLVAKQKEHLNKFQADNQSSWKTVQNEISKVSNKLTTENQHLQSQVNQQLVGVEKDLKTQFTKTLKEWTAKQRAEQPNLDEIEDKYRQELKSTIDPICTSFLEIEGQLKGMRNSIDKIEPKYHQELISVVNPIRSSMQDFDEQIQKMRTWLIASVLVAAVSISFSSWALISAVNSNSSGETTEANR